MTDPKLTFENLSTRLLEAIPELSPAYDNYVKEWGEDLGPHLTMARVFNDTLASELKKKSGRNEPLLAKMFTFLESISASAEPKIKEVVVLTICGAICADEAMLQHAQRYLGRRSRKVCDDIIAGKTP